MTLACSDHFLAARATKDDLAFVGQATDDLEDFLLFAFDFREAYRAARLEIFAQHLRRTL